MNAHTPVVTRWWWLRHAPVNAPEGMIVGQMDVDAKTQKSEPFRDMAKLLPHPDRWLVSPLKRTRQSAEALCRHGELDGQFTIEADLAEQSFGRWQGLNHDEISRKFPDEHRIFWSDPANQTPPGGESFSHLITRVHRAVHAHRGQDNHNVIAVAHAGTIRAALAIALEISPANALSFAIDPLSLTRIDHISHANNEESWRIEGVNILP